MSDLSHDARKSFSANESYRFFSYIKNLKPVAVTYAFLNQVLQIDKYFRGVVYMRDETGQKIGNG